MAVRPNLREQIHPLVKPLDFYSPPLVQPRKPLSTVITLLSDVGAQQALSMPLGARNQPVAGRVFSFTMAGTIRMGSSDGTLTVTPFYGTTVNGPDLGQSTPQSYSASITPQPWRLKGEIIFQQISLAQGAALARCSGSFSVNNNVAVIFGSPGPINVNLRATSAKASGALNFSVTFTAFGSATSPAISTKYAFLNAF
jgi:hypothetical protein